MRGALLAAAAIATGAGAVVVPGTPTPDGARATEARQAPAGPTATAPNTVAIARAQWLRTRYTPTGGYLRRPPWTNARYRRAAAKARRVAANRRAHRG